MAVISTFVRVMGAKAAALSSAVALAAAVFAAAPPASAQPAAQPGASPAKAVCLYLVKDVSRSGEIYLGEFFVLRKVGNKLTGYSGAFYSEWGYARGVIRGTTVQMKLQDPYGSKWASAVMKWDAREQRLRGWEKVRKAKFAKYSGGYGPLPGQVCA